MFIFPYVSFFIIIYISRNYGNNNQKTKTFITNSKYCFLDWINWNSNCIDNIKNLKKGVGCNVVFHKEFERKVGTGHIYKDH
ncbi:MAG: hypothetical protein WCG91_04060 [Candidatus Shapirobacteria bacterium]